MVVIFTRTTMGYIDRILEKADLQLCETLGDDSQIGIFCMLDPYGFSPVCLSAGIVANLFFLPFSLCSFSRIFTGLLSCKVARTAPSCIPSLPVTKSSSQDRSL